jgi:two-component system sensor histidine kinase EvgS
MTFNLTTLEPLATVAEHPQKPELASAMLNILVVDDHPANSLLLCQQLEFLGHRCAVAEQGAKGLELWLAGHFDLVVTDCNMPIMNGYDLSRAIRAREQKTRQQRCSVWGFTANAQPEEKQRCREAGMDDCLFKPISLTSLNERLGSVHPRDETGRETLNVTPVKLQPVFSMASVSALTGERPEMIRRLLEQLLQSSEQDRHQLTAVLSSDDQHELCQLAHRIKGAARIIRATRVIEACEALEDACQEATTAEIIKQRQQAIEVAMLNLEQALREVLNSAA